MFYAINNVDLDEEEYVVSQVIGFAWDCELIRVGRSGRVLFLDIGQPMVTDLERLIALFQRVVAPNPEPPESWRVVHQHGPEDD